MSKQVENRFMLIRNVIYMFYLTNPQIKAGHMYIIWDKNKVLSEYPRPRYEVLKSMLRELREVI